MILRYTTDILRCVYWTTIMIQFSSVLDINSMCPWNKWMLLCRMWRLLDVDRRLFCTLEYLIAQYVVEATELSLRVNNDPLYVCSILFVVKSSSCVTSSSSPSSIILIISILNIQDLLMPKSEAKKVSNWSDVFPWLFHIIIITPFFTYLEINFLQKPFWECLFSTTR